MKRFNPAIHRARDLWIEVDLLNPSVPREPIYARLGVPEVWRYRNGSLSVRLLGHDGHYGDSQPSAAFPFLPISRFAGFISRKLERDETKVLLELRDWLRKLPI